MKHKAGNEDKEETWTIRTEMAISPWRFRVFITRLGAVPYNRERMETAIRQFVAEKDALRGAGLRPQIRNRIAHSEAELTWGTLNIDKPGDDFVTRCDCAPFTADSYE